jgi:hypothetical protein
MTHPPESDPLRPMLKEAQSELARHLDEACEHDDVEEESTAQLMRLEEALTDAAQAAKQAVSLRRRLRTEQAAGDIGERDDFGDEPGGPAPRDPAPDRRAPRLVEQEPSTMREFRDALGIVWRVWAVTPGQLHPERSGGQRLGEYSGGWLAFESQDGSQRRRLPHYPGDWSHRTNHALELLLDSAEPVRARRKTAGDDADASSR